jgi:hypothetical protein
VGAVQLKFEHSPVAQKADLEELEESAQAKQAAIGNGRLGKADRYWPAHPVRSVGHFKSNGREANDVIHPFPAMLDLVNERGDGQGCRDVASENSEITSRIGKGVANENAGAGLRCKNA